MNASSFSTPPSSSPIATAEEATLEEPIFPVGSHQLHDIAARLRSEGGSVLSSGLGTGSPTPPPPASRSVPTEDLLDMLRRKDNDIERLLVTITELTSGVRANSLDALKILREDVERREKAVTERENRVWGWRLIASARDAELEQAVAAINEQERNLHEKERGLREKEAQLARREEAVEQRSLLLNEEYILQSKQLREELQRLKNRTKMPVSSFSSDLL